MVAWVGVNKGTLVSVRDFTAADYLLERGKWDQRFCEGMRIRMRGFSAVTPCVAHQIIALTD